MKNKTTAAFILALVAQLVMLSAVAARHVYTRMTGTPVVLKTAPLDPYSIMSGYYVVLSYEISRVPDKFKGSPDKMPVYVTLVPGQDGVWKAATYDTSWPKEVPQGAVVLKGRKNFWRLEYGIEAYFLPEKMRNEINKTLWDNRDSSLVTIMVDSTGHAALLRMQVKDKVYEY